MAQGKRWCFTLNNPRVNDHPTIWLKNIAKFGFQYEKGLMETCHIQGWAVFDKKMRLNELKNLNSKCHWETMKGSLKSNEDYCSKKDGSISVYFTNSKVEKNSMLELKQNCEEEKDLKNVFEQNFALSCRYHAFIQKYHGMMAKPREKLTVGLVIIGPTGCGKSAQIRHSFDVNETYWKPQGQWWDGYQQQRVVVFDEFYSWTPYSELLRLLDRYPLKVQIKGSFVEFNSEIIIFTSNIHWDSWYSNIDNKTALMRRLSVKIDMNFMNKEDWWKGPLKVSKVTKFHNS